MSQGNSSICVVKELECPVCMEYMTAAICMCQCGHSICKNCRDNKNITKCPICEADFVSNRNIALERISSLIKYPCRNCNLLFEANEIDEHEKYCEIKVRCPLEFMKCTFQKSYGFIQEHITKYHKNYLNTWQSHKNINIYISFFNQETFAVIGKNLNGNVRMYSAMYIGPGKNARNFCMRIEFSDQTNRGYSLIATTPCIPQCSIESAFHGDKICVSREMLNNFKIKSGKFVSDITFLHKSNEEKLLC